MGLRRCEELRVGGEVGLARAAIGKSGIGAISVVEDHPTVGARHNRGYAVVGVQTLFILLVDAPEPLNEDIDPPARFAAHADLNVLGPEYVVADGDCGVCVVAPC